MPFFHRSQPALKLRDIHRIFVQIEFLVPLNREDDALFRPDGVARGGWKLDVESAVQHRSCHHEDHQQDQDDVHKRDDINLGHEAATPGFEDHLRTSTCLGRVFSELRNSRLNVSTRNTVRRIRVK